MELHTFSSLTAEFLKQYNHCMQEADVAVIFYSPHAIELKKLPPISPEMIFEAFGRPDLKIFNDTDKLLTFLYNMEWQNSVLLMMSSGNFGGIKFPELSKKIVPLRPKKL